MYPFIVVTDQITLPVYLLILSTVYSLSIFWIYYQAEKKGFDRALTLDFCLAIMIGGFLGARILHIFYESPDYYLENLLNVFKIWQGGFVFFGGFIGALLATLAYSHYKQQNYGLWADFFTPLFPVGYAFGRLGCFFNGCCYGKICELSWAIEFNHPGLPTGLRHPTQLYAFFWELLVSLPLCIWTGRYLQKTKQQKKLAGAVFLVWIAAHSAGRIIMEFFRDDYRGFMPLELSIATWISALLLLVSLVWLKVRYRFFSKPDAR